MSRPRLAFTIVYNGLHHLKHKGFTDFMLSNFDLWVIVEGQAKNGGSTGWCNDIETPAQSDDGTVEFLQSIKAKNKVFYTPGVAFASKDHQVNKAIQFLQQMQYKYGFLWQVDVDEHWTVEKLQAAERFAENSPHMAFSFEFNHYVKKLDDGYVVARGDWGTAYVNRLWKWHGQYFKTHEPAVLHGQKYAQAIPGILFDHYSYVFEKDVKHKSLYYGGHQFVYENWKRLDSLEYPAHISALFGETPIGRSNSYLHKIINPCVAQNQELEGHPAN